MDDGSLPATDIAALIRAETALAMGRPWPRDLHLIIFNTSQGWKCGLPPAKHGDDIPYRDAALQIAFQLQKRVRLKPDTPGGKQV